jgi:hypothetical protein
MHDLKEAVLCLILPEEQISPLFLFLQSGFHMKAKIGCSLSMFLTEQLLLSREYIEQTIQTIFLDGKPVDDLNSAMIHDGSRLSLSAAMPGLVGAAMRRGGFYASLRDSITYHEATDAGVLGEGLVFIKLFNLLMQDLGARFLKQGILVAPQDIIDFLSQRPDSFRLSCTGIFLNEKPLTWNDLQNLDLPSLFDMVFFIVKTELD